MDPGMVPDEERLQGDGLPALQLAHQITVRFLNQCGHRRYTPTLRPDCYRERFV
jgi:hypothetical protein